MAVQKPNIKQYINNQPKPSPSLNGKKVASNDLLSPGNPMFAIAQGVVENLSTPYKIAIGAVIYLILSGVISNFYLIYKLITLAF